LLVGVYEKKELIFVAKVKNGFVPRVRDELFPALKALQTAQCPFKNLPEKRASRWGESLTAEKVEWTESGHLSIARSSACGMTKSLRKWFGKVHSPPACESEKQIATSLGEHQSSTATC
jgi:hypothetical protein